MGGMCSCDGYCAGSCGKTGGGGDDDDDDDNDEFHHPCFFNPQTREREREGELRMVS